MNVLKRALFLTLILAAPALQAQTLTPKRICDNPLITSAADDLYFMVSAACSSTKSIKWSDLETTSDEAGFLSSGALTCGASTAGKVLVHTTPLQYCDDSGTPTLRYAAYGNGSGNPIGTHSSLSGLTSGDDHTQYTLLAGRSGGQTLIGGTASGNSLTLRSTSDASRGKIILGNAGATAYDEVNERVGIGTASPTTDLDVDKSTSGAVTIRLQNDSNGTGADARFTITNDSGNSLFGIMRSSGNTATAMGITVANYAGISASNSAAGLLVYTAGSAPLVMGTNNAEHFRIDSSGHLIHKMASAPTVACTGTGTSPAAPTVTGTDQGFIVTVNTGTTPSATGTCTVTFAASFTNTPAISCMLVSGASAWGTTATIRLTTESTTAPVFSWANGGVSLTGSSSYKFSCIALGI